MPIKLSEEEKIVLTVVREYLNKNRQFNVENILPFIISRFRLASINISKNGIEDTLKTLIKNNLIVEGSKLSREDILLNFKRLKIYNYILRNPGIYFNKIHKELNLSNHVVVWHLNMLLKFNYIKKEILENHKIYFDSNMQFDDVRKNYYLSKDKIKKIINHLEINNTGITKTQLSKELKMHPNTLTKYLEPLQNYNIIIKKEISNKILYYLN